MWTFQTANLPAATLPSSPRAALPALHGVAPKYGVLLLFPGKALANLGAAKSYPLHSQFCITNKSMQQLLSEWTFPSLSKKHLLTYLCLLFTREKGGIGKCGRHQDIEARHKEALYHECHVMCLYQLHFLEIHTRSWMAQAPCGLQMATGNSHYNSSLCLWLPHLKRIIKGNNLFAKLVEVLTVFVVVFLLKNLNYFKLPLSALSSTMRQ